MATPDGPNPPIPRPTSGRGRWAWRPGAAVAPFPAAPRYVDAERSNPPYSASDKRRGACAVQARRRDRLFHRGSTTVSGSRLDVIGLIGRRWGIGPIDQGPAG